jgi:hypothetical protein
MLGAKSQSSIRPIALGATVQSSTYGQTIPLIYGRCLGAIYLTWNANLRQGSSTKKLKKILTLGKKGGPSYVQNTTLLLGHNPIAAALQFWINQNQQLPLNFTSVSSTHAAGSASSITVSDSNFYRILGVTLTASYSETFNDYGSQGSRTVSGTYEIPLWNTAYNGPDPTASSGIRYFPYTYYWLPGSGATIQIPNCALGLIGGQFNIYYAQLDPGGSSQYSKNNGNTDVPIASLRLTFEPVLGDGPEYSGYTSQQILYPHYAGMGSPDLDMGASDTMPVIVPEVLGSFPVYATGDADHADMAEDIFKAGPTQAGFGSENPYSEIQHGLGCCDYPGCIQTKIANSASSFSQATYDLPNTAGNPLVVAAQMGSGSLSISSSNGETWTSVISGSGYAVWRTIANGGSGALNQITISPAGAGTLILMEPAGVDTYDTAASLSATTSFGNQTNVPFSTSGVQTRPEYSLGIVIYPQSNPALPVSPQWNSQVSIANLGISVQCRTTFVPNSFNFPVQMPAGSGPLAWDACVIAFSCSQPPAYAKPLGNILEPTTLALTWAQDRANGLYGSYFIDSQKTASDILTDLCQAMNCAPVWAGFQLQLIPMSEVSAVGNGATYIAPTAAGPIVNLREEDFIFAAGDAPVSLERTPQPMIPNLLQVQHPNRASEYNDVLVSQPETASIALLGPRKASPKQLRMIQDVAISRMILGIMIQRANYLRNVYKFKLNARWKPLLPMDLITIPLSATMPNPGGIPTTTITVPLRLTSIAEDDKYNLDCQAEPFIYGCSAPVPVSITNPTPNIPQVGASPGSVNTPVFLEPVPRLAGTSVAQLWMAVSAASTVYGGCLVYLSTDGGNSYNQVATIQGNAITGYTVGDWPAHADPDTTNNLSVDLTESNGVLSSYQTADRDNFVYPCYVAGGVTACPYELMTYNTATLTATSKYTLEATGSGNELRRAVFGAPAALNGVDHPNNSRFAFLGPQGPGLAKLTMDPLWIGKTLYFKFLAYNNLLGAPQSLSAATAYTYTPVGTAAAQNPNIQNYTQSPANALTNPTSTTIVMAAVTEQFPSSTAAYQGRSFTITAPSTPTTYYVFILDPGYIGDAAGTPFTSVCSTSQADAGQPGYIYIGSIVAEPAGGGTIVTPGGWPPPQLFLVGP